MVTAAARECDDARGESRTLMGLPPTDFESVASAIPPLGRVAEYKARALRSRLQRDLAPDLRARAGAYCAADQCAGRTPHRDSQEDAGARERIARVLRGGRTQRPDQASHHQGD